MYGGTNSQSNKDKLKGGKAWRIKDFNFDIEILDSLLLPFLMRVKVRHTVYVQKIF